MNKRKNILISLLPLILIPAAYLFISFYQNTLSRYIFPCPIRLFFGIYCPGCGGTHCVYAVSELHFISAVKYNAAVFSVFVFAFLYWLENLLALSGKNIKLIPVSRKFYLCFSGIVIIYLILRNYIPALSPF